MPNHLFRVHRSHLLTAVTAAFEAVDTKNTIPILSNILLRPDGDKLWVRATDLNIEIEAKCDLIEEGTGESVTLAGSHLRDILKNLPETAEIDFLPGALKGQVRLKSGRASFAVLTLPDTDFPSMAHHVKGNSFVLDMKSLSRAFAKVAYAVEHAGSDRYYLTGIYIHPDDEGSSISAVATNGHCLAAIQIPASEKVEFKGIILPLKAATAIRKLMGDVNEADVIISENIVQIASDGVRIVSNLIDGSFPDYKRVIPVGNAINVRAPVNVLTKAIKRVCLVAGDLTKESMVMTAEGERMEIRLSSRDGEVADDEISVDYGGDQFRIGFNGSLIEKTLESIATTDVDMFFGESNSPAIFKPTTELSELFVVMPMRIGS